MRFTKCNFVLNSLNLYVFGLMGIPDIYSHCGDIETDADNYTSVHDYSTVKFDKGFVFTGLSNNMSIDLGFNNYSGIYIGHGITEILLIVLADPTK